MPDTRLSRLSSISQELVEVLSSMRFAISLLALICIAAVVGTVVQQRQPTNNYINQFGPFWAELFGRLDLYTVYGATWFLVILVFLIISTSLCVKRNTPKILRDLRDLKLNLRAQSLQAYRHRAQAHWPQTPDAAHAELVGRLRADGWSPKFVVRSDGTMMAARKGSMHKLGYIAAHSAIVLILVGGVLDGDLIVRLMAQWQGKTLYTGTGNSIPNAEPHRLDARNPSFRANLFVPEGDRSGLATILMPSGLYLQQLPFELELKKFVVEYYDTGMPKLFASDVVVRSTDGQERQARIEVNKPFIVDGVAIYQSSFEDGGSQLQLRATPFDASAPADLQAQIGTAQPLPGSNFSLEPAELRVINVENFDRLQAPVAASESAASMRSKFSGHLGAGAQRPGEKTLRNIGPSITYRLRDEAGQAIEFHNYMVPVDIDGTRVFLAGVRETAQEEFRYLRIPADENDALAGWLRLRRALNDATLRAQAAAAFAHAAAPADRHELRQQLQTTANLALSLFAGKADTEKDTAQTAGLDGGLPALSRHIESTVPTAEREAMMNVMLRVLNGGVLELDRIARGRDNVAVPAPDEARQRFLTQSVLSLSDSNFYPVPWLVSLEGFQQRQASVFQVARAPGQKVVYLGVVLLTIGVFSMLYVRERRIWLWLTPGDQGGSHITLALSSPRQSSELEADFQRLCQLVQADPSRIPGPAT